MLRNISVRTFILSYLMVVFLLIDGLVISLAPQTPLLISLNILFIVAFMFLRIYMTRYLVVPINTVKEASKKLSPAIWALLFLNLVITARGD